MDFDLDELTLGSASELLDRRKLSSRELLDALLGRIDETEPRVGAYRQVMRESALDAACRADEELAERGQWRGPLHGIPVAVKDLCYTADAPTEAGSELLRGFRSTYDATVVQRLRNGGAIIVGKTTTSEFASAGGGSTTTRNPWDPQCTPSGSSTGSAVSLAVRSSLGTIGTDAGGSIRGPAASNGVVGMKPTWGLVSRFGVLSSDSLSHVGPLARTVDDCALLLGVIAGPDRLDPETARARVFDYAGDVERGASGIRLGVELNFLRDDRTADLARSAVEDALASFHALGVEVIEIEFDDVELILPVLHAIFVAETGARHRDLLTQKKTVYGERLRQLVQLGQLVPVSDYIVAQQLRRRLGNGLRRLFERHHLDCMIVPAHAAPASVRSDRPPSLLDFDLRCGLANLTGLPAISVPAGFTDNGLPLAFELYGRPFGERTLFQVAAAYERLNSWFRRVPPAVKGS